MDLGIAGKNALVCAASKGLGRGCATSLAREGVNVTICSRTKADITRTADEISAATGAKVTAVACDITTPEGRDKALAAAGDVDILVNNAGGPPPGDFRDWTPDDWHAAVNANMITAIELIRRTIDGMIDRKLAVSSISPRLGQITDRHSRPIQWRAHRLDRVLRRDRARGGGPQCHDQRPIAGSLRYRSVARQHEGASR